MSKTKKKITIGLFALFMNFAFFSLVRAETLKIGFVTDWEYGGQSSYDHKLPKKAERFLNVAVNHYNSVFQPDLVVGGGDYILGRGVSKKKAGRQMRHINNVFAKTAAPRLYCIGNHDLGNMSKAEVEANLGISYSHSVTDIKGIRIITLDTNNLIAGRKKYGTNGIISNEELIWLDGQLNTNQPVFVFAHHSPIQTPDGKNWRISIVAAEALAAVLEKYGNVVAVFSGHHAVNYTTQVNGINYVIINNLTDQKALGSFAAIAISRNEENNVSVHIDQFGKKPASYDFSKTVISNQ